MEPITSLGRTTSSTTTAWTMRFPRPVLRWLILCGVLAIVVVLLISRGGGKEAVSQDFTSTSSPESRNNAPESRNDAPESRNNAPERSNNAPEPATSHPDNMYALSGYTFTGEAVRTFPVEELKFRSVTSKTSPERAKLDPWCARWGVVTTIFEPSEAVRRWVRVKGWCLVIVADRKSPKVYDTRWKPGEGNGAVVYLTPEDQKALNIEFVNNIPWNNFGRKNIGFLYAVMHGATVIWDFDDDNMLKFWIPGAAPEGALSIDGAIPSGQDDETIQVIEPQNHRFPTYNPYPALGAPALPSWPRGIPLAHIKLPDCYDTQAETREIRHRSIAVLQSLADYQPDVDAIYRITMPIPFSFKRSNGTKPLMVPKGVLTPYNAQATLHLEAGFWALLLPITVHARVADIWRSYFVQRLFWDVGLQLGFLARPIVVQDRNPHSNLGDLDAEADLYQKSEHLVKFLGRWKGKGKTLVARVEELWVALYEHKYIEVEDVMHVQRWLQSLLDVGYTFPELVNTPSSSYSSMYQPTVVAKGEEDREDAHMDGCKTASLKFWTSDLYESGGLNMPSALATMGHNVVLAGHKRADPSVSRKKGFSVYRKVSNVISRNYISPSTMLTEKMVKDNFEFYKGDQQIASTDAFICTFPASMCEMWMPFNKTIMFLPAHRYNLGRCDKEEWDRLNQHVDALVSMDNPKHIIGAEGVYDQEYLRYYTGVDPLLLNSVSGFDGAQNTYAPTKDEILAFGTWDKRLKTEIQNFKIKPVNSIYPSYQPSDLVSHRAAVFLPKFVMSYNLTELYSLGIPLFIPSMDFIRNVRRTVTNSRSSLSRLYCKKSKDMKPHPRSTHPYSPNVVMAEDKEAELYWLQFADFFNWPHITYFDDFKDLERRLEGANFRKIHALMMDEVEQRKKELLLNLCKASKKIRSGQMVPKDYNLAINLLYGGSNLQAS